MSGQARIEADMASSILKGLVTNYGKPRYQLWHRPLKMASLVYEKEMGIADTGVTKKCHMVALIFSHFFAFIFFFQFEISVAAIDQTTAKPPFASTGALQILGGKYAARLASGIP